MTAIVAIPARLKSTRFPRKVLADINGKPMLWYVYSAVNSAQRISGTWVLSDSQDVLDAAESWGAQTMLTDEDCPSGTARIASVIDRIEADYVINVQGDEPLMTTEVVDTLITALENSDADVVTPVFRIETLEDLTDVNLNKVVRAADGRALYFSHNSIPFVRDEPQENWLAHAPFWGHVGVYGYRRKVLEEYDQLPVGLLEGAEKLEQLRLLEAGKTILTVELNYRPIGVDVPADLDKVKKILAAETGSNDRNL